MGRLHKKKFSEYAEAADNEEQRNEKDGEQANNVDGGADKSLSSVESETEEVENTKIPKDPVAVDDEPDQDEVADDFQSLHEDDEEPAEKNGSTKKVAPKRKSAQSAKKSQDNEENAAGDSDDEPLNGGGDSTPAKRGRKTGAAKPKAKAGKAAAAGGRGKGAKKAVEVEVEEEDDEEPEEEYEVKDIVDHKVERGATLYLIRWKGYNKEDDTWEPEDTLSCPDIIEKYKKKTSSNNGAKATPKKSVSPGKKAGKKSAGKAASKEDPNKEWEVEKIIDYSEEKGGRVFRIRWKGFGPKNDTWEPEKNLCCNDLIQKFMKRMDSQKNISFKELREEPKKTKRLVNETAPRTNYHNPVGRKSKRSGSKKRVYYGDSDD